MKSDAVRKGPQAAPHRSLLNALGMTPEEMLEALLGDFGLEILDRMPVAFSCDCTKERVEKALVSIGKKELQDMIDDGKEIEVNCQFCNRHYVFSVEELKGLFSRAVRD